MGSILEPEENDMEFAAVLEIIVSSLAVLASFFVGRSSIQSRNRKVEQDERAREIAHETLEERETRELVERVAAKRFPALAGK